MISVVAIIAYLALPIVLNTNLNRSLMQNPVLLLVGDFTTDESFGALLERGVNVADNLRSSGIHPTLMSVVVNEPSVASPIGFSPEILDRELVSLRSRLIEEIVNNNVVAIISANASQSAAAVLQVGKAFNIPVLLTVATHDKVIDGYENIAFRLIARDSSQAEEITKWCVSKGGRVGLVSELSAYGIGLRDALISQIGPLSLVQFYMSTTTDVAGILKYGKEAGVKSWVVISYRNQAIEFFSKKDALDVDGEVLFSDGAYGYWLNKLPETTRAKHKLSLSFPSNRDGSDTQQAQQSGREQIGGYSVFGYDAYRLVMMAIDDLDRSAEVQKPLLAKAIRHVAPRLVQDEISHYKYDFDERGENTKARFSVTEVQNGRLP